MENIRVFDALVRNGTLIPYASGERMQTRTNLLKHLVPKLRRRTESGRRSDPHVSPPGALVKSTTITNSNDYASLQSITCRDRCKQRYAKHGQEVQGGYP